MTKHIFTGFGFGPIQAGLFVNEAYLSGNFSRIAIAEIDQKLVEAIRANNGNYYVNIAGFDSIRTAEIKDIEIYNPTNSGDRFKLLDALSVSTEIVTSLPSVDFYYTGENSVAELIAAGLNKTRSKAAIIYTAENNNHAAEILAEAVESKLKKPLLRNVQFLNTVIGKMSHVIRDPQEIKEKGLTPIAPGIQRAFLVEKFNKILVTKCNIAGFKPGIEVFIEKEDLLPFEEAKLYGHNAIHAILAYLGAYKGYCKMKELKEDAEIMQIAKDAFINESGTALIRKYKYLEDRLFTEPGYKEYAEDLLERMTNPYLGDTVERAARDPLRKLGLNDRIFGTMSLALKYGIEPVNMAKGAAAGVVYLAKQEKLNSLKELKNILAPLWQDNDSKFKSEIIRLTEKELISLSLFN
jgi:mannitol-1-phosphate 5-dehydrogenase